MNKKIDEVYTESLNDSKVDLVSHEGESSIEIENEFPIHHVICDIWTSHHNVATTWIYLRSPSGTSTQSLFVRYCPEFILYLPS